MADMHYVKIDFTDEKETKRTFSMDSSLLRTHGIFYQHYLFTYITEPAPLKCLVCGIDCPPPNYSIKDRFVNEGFLIFVYEGKGTVNGKSFGADQFFMLPPNYSTTLVCDSINPWKLCWISWKGQMSDYFNKMLSHFDPARPYQLSNSYGIQKIISSMIYADHSHADTFSTATYFANYLISLIYSDIIPADTVAETEKQSRHKIRYAEKAKAIMTEQYATININSLSDTLHLNAKYFSQIFREITGIPPQQFLIDIRLQNSIFCLENTNMTLRDVAYSCGYLSYTGYVDAFKRKYGVSPGEYRKRMNKKGKRF